MSTICPIFNVGCFSHCEKITLNIQAIQQGIHTLNYEWLGNKYSFDFFADAGENIVLVSHPFNEDSSVCFSITNPDSTQYEHTLDTTTYNRFKITIKFGFDNTNLMTNDDLLCDNCEACD